MASGAALLDSLAEEYVGPYVQIYFKKITTWQTYHVLAFAVVVLGTLELVVSVLPLILSRATWIPVNPKLHLDTLSARDKLFILINKVSIVLFAYHMFQVVTLTPTVKWKAEEATLTNSLLVLVPMYLLYDFVYTLFHRVLHLRCVYGYVHKHHHRQMSPSRGHYDAINVHPFEFLCGEYLNLFCFWAVPCHIFAVIAFVSVAIVTAALNHTRFDVSIPGVFDPKDHLVHHRLPDANFGQYTMFWDKLYGWHCPWSKLSKSA
mmetsp:Transcript_26448/g.61698  ORF Transcript_26448/g.61698 Transcript_26448/m.61698 type:complete len:262 (-) Transcript_26448:198-983(-)